MLCSNERCVASMYEQCDMLHILILVYVRIKGYQPGVRDHGAGTIAAPVQGGCL